MTDFTTLSRSQWLELADRFYARLFPGLEGMSPAQWERATPYFGWRGRDVLAHMIGAIPVNLRQVLDRALTGDPSAPPEYDTFRRNAREVARRRRVPLPSLIDELRSQLDAILAIYRRISDADWLQPAWFFVGRVNVRTLFAVQLADNVLHERDLRVAAGTWRGLDPEFALPLVDWFMRELRVATFRPDRAAGLRATVGYHLAGESGGEWTMTIAEGRCRVERGGQAKTDLVVKADAEDVICAAQARAAPWIGTLARTLQWAGGLARAEDTVAGVTGIAAGALALLRRRIVVEGNRSLARRVNGAFWHFWQRTPMTAANIAKG